MIIVKEPAYNVDKLRQCIEKQRHAEKGLCSQGNGLPKGHVKLWEENCKEDRMSKNWCLQIVVLGKTPESHLDSKEIKPGNLKGYQLWIFTGGTDTEAEAPVFWSSDMNRWLTEKVPDTGKDGGQKETRVLEDELAGWHHWCNKHEFGQTPGDGEGQGGLACYSPWGHKKLGTVEWLNNNKS